MQSLTYGSVCSGIEAFSVAVQGMRFSAKWLAEIEPFCVALLAERYPHAENYGDITKREPDDFERVDVVVGGTPCQSFSVNGKRLGMADVRGQLSLRFCEIVASCEPRWVIWENVENALRIDGGRAFACILQRLGQLGYCCAWRVLDARYFGVPQRRRRVFLVAHNRSWRHAGAVLFEPRADGQDAAKTRKVRQGKRVDAGAQSGAIGWTGDETPKHGIECVPTLRALQGGEGVGVCIGGRFSKLTVNEWERLQGFPDDYTKLAGWSDSVRRKALGNSFCVNVVRWIAKRIEALEFSNLTEE